MYCVGQYWMAEDKPERKTSGRNPPGGSVAAAVADTDGKTKETVPRESGGGIGKNRRLASIRSRISIEELKNVYKRQVTLSQDDSAEPIFDPMAKAQESLMVVRGKTGVVYCHQMTNHLCFWDPQHMEKPERLLCILDRCQELGLLQECERLECRAAKEEEVLNLHSPAHFGLLQTTSSITDQEKLEDLSSRFDSVYFHPGTFESALLAAGGTLDLVDAVASGRLQNGFAIVRPPGHHAMESEFCGYSFINNVALATRQALNTHGLSRILIVDWDVHHGQGTQQAFYSDPRVLYFSIHRYEHGSFWPNLRESNYDYIGQGNGKGFNFNVPLNSIGMANQDFLAILHQVLLPVAYEFSPELVIVSAGFDAAIGCHEFGPELVIVSGGFDSAVGDSKGEMEVSPGLYAHLTSHLMTLAQGKVAVVLEGGYYLPSLAESAAMTLSALLGHPCPSLMDPIIQPSKSLQETLLSLVYVQRPYWKCFQYQGSFSLEEVRGDSDPKTFTPSLSFMGLTSCRPLRFPTRDNVEPRTPEALQRINDKFQCLRQKEGVRVRFEPRLCLVYDEGMELHHSLTEGEHPERPERIRRVWEMLSRVGVVERCRVLQSRRAQHEEVELVHTKEHVEFMYKLESMDEEELQILQESYKSVYLHPKTNDCALLSAGCLLQVVEEVWQGRARAGVGLIRPPGHHAEPDQPHGFCFYNNVAVAARHAIHNLGCQRVLIVDWDVHHGNGIQHAFEEEPRVLYVSLHRYDHGLFFPSSEDANFDRVGRGPGEGFTINIPWNKSGMGDAEYMAAFTQVIMPVAYQFNPQLVLVAAGFDAARGDPLGGCRTSPECYGHMTSLLAGLAEGRVVLALEGGYNLTTISYCMTLCAKALLGDPMPPLEAQLVPNKSAVHTINEVISVHSKYWSALCFQVELPLQDVLQQGCGGGPQGVDSGVSGSEASLSPSPISIPSPVKSRDSSPSTTTTTSPYVSAPSSPAKPIFMECEVKTNDVQECLSDSKETASSVGARPRTQQPKKTPNRTPHKPRQASNRSVDRQRSTPKKHGKVAAAMQAAIASQSLVKGPTGVVCVERDKGGSLAETIVNQCQALDLWQACNVLSSQPAMKAEVFPEKILQHLCSANVVNGLRGERTGDASLQIAGSVAKLLQEILDGKFQNGMALTEAMDGLHSGVALAVHSVLSIHSKARMVVVDFGNCVEPEILDHLFSHEPRVLVLSVRQCQYASGSTSRNKGRYSNVLSVDINCNIAESSHDYLTLVHQLLLPVIYEFGPQMVVMTAACEWNIYPAFLPNMAGLFLPVTSDRLVMAVEIDQQRSIVVNEGIVGALSTLLGRPYHPKMSQSESLRPEVCQTILEVMKAQQGNWKSLRYHALASLVTSSTGKQESLLPSHLQQQTIKPQEDALLKPKELECFKEGQSVCLVYSEAMKEHLNYADSTHPECPDRISCIFEQLCNFGIVERCQRLKAREATLQELERVHSSRHIKFMSGLQALKPSELHHLENSFDSIYLHRRTNRCALLAAGSILTAVDCVMSGSCQHGVAVVRPPGHHAERNNPCGFCFYNSVGVAAQHAVTSHHLQRVLVLDWDVHHGNGTQHMFESDPRVLYISIHRYDNGRFFPGSADANYNRVGLKKGKGFNINIPWNKGGMGDAEYLAAFLEVVLPVATEFNPQLVLISAGFDAAVGDPLGGCNVTPECYGHMTKFLTCVGDGRVIVALEGGYNLTSISYCMTLCAKALLGDPLPCLSGNLTPCQSAVDSLINVVGAHCKFWSSLNLKGKMVESPRKQASSISTQRPISSPTSSQAVDELAASLSQVSMAEATPRKIQTEEKKEEAPGGELEGACGGGHEDSATTLILSDCLGAQELYAVVPVSWCPHLEEVQPVPDGTLNTSSACEECYDTSENWCCLTCYKVLCGRFVSEHMLMHGVCEEHHMVLSFSDLSIWCYACDSYVHNPVLFEAKRAAHLDKFGLEPPECS
ncbi:histone deacetylase 6-like isoform X3 [Portunus trituberculatus]|uniref:histone deacetylase 6-like isoform X3 n=1 Tax=Portunus trituberculatus TaxID=210409 RepID=UPI001E1D1F00|nr:histone deacetylase 6-like isoform X3 [Portunus trituberculatus]